MSAFQVKILVVDDQYLVRKLLRDDLHARGYHVIEADTALCAMRLLAEKPQLIMLELSLPDASGIEFLKSLREMGCTTPLIVVSRVKQEDTIVLALEYGADDFVTKPFNTGELMARVGVALRHGIRAQPVTPLFVSDGLSVDLTKRIVKVDGAEARLSPKEYEILALLVQNAGKVVMQNELLERVWTSKTDPQYVRTYIRQIRIKVERLPNKPRHILTINGVGYRLQAPTHATE